jgi:hypothetical protein
LSAFVGSNSPTTINLKGRRFLREPEKGSYSLCRKQGIGNLIGD